MKHVLLTIFSCFLTTFANAEDMYLNCQGPGAWSLEIEGDTGRLFYPDPISMDLMLTTTAESQDWPRALTFVGDRDTAIAIIDQRDCNQSEIAIEVLTQRNQAPVLLTGCCEELR